MANQFFRSNTNTLHATRLNLGYKVASWCGVIADTRKAVLITTELDFVDMTKPLCKRCKDTLDKKEGSNAT